MAQTKDSVQSVEVAKVERRDLTEQLHIVGSLAANESAQITAEVPGLIRAILFEEGMAVRKGQVLVRIDSAELNAQLAQGQANFRLAQLNLQRAQALHQAATITEADLDRQRSEYDAAKAQLDVIRVRLEKTEIRAPFDGILGSRTVSVGDYVSNQTNITRIEDLSRLKVEFSVPERALPKIHLGASFRLLSNGSANETKEADAFSGKVYFINATIDRATRASQVKGLLDHPDPSLRPGMFANVEIELERREAVLTVPESALLHTEEGVSLIKVGSNGGSPVAEFLPVRVGLRARGLAEIITLKAPLSENDEVVASGVGALILYPGAKLAPRPLNAKLKP